jgi:hypothetical protein
MMFKSLTNDVQAIDRIAALKPTDLLADQRRPLADMPALVKGHIYHAKILEVAVNGTLRVEVEGRQLVLTMPQHWKAGDHLSLKYMGDTGGMNFQLLTGAENSSEQVSLSPIAKEVVGQIKLAQREGMDNVYQASIPATNNPQHVKQFAGDLQHAVELTGLFYESHLAEFAQGVRSLSSLISEPQNQGGPISHHLMAQQLNVLETQRLIWHGEVWPGQLAEWQLKIEDQPADAALLAESVVQSHLSLELPNLGKVRASLQLIGNRLSLSIVADHAHTTHALRARSQALIDAFKAHPVKLKAISIAQEQQDDG